MSILDDLMALQRQDAIIRDLEQQLKDIPRRKEHERNRIKSEEGALALARDVLMQTRADIQAAELEVASQKEAIIKLKNQQMLLKSNTEYAARGKEIRYKENDLAKMQKTLTERQERLEPALREEKEHLAKYEAAKEDVDRYLEELDGIAAGAERELVVEREKGGALRKPLDVPGLGKRYLVSYDRLAKTRWPAIVGVAEGNVCSGCHMVLPAAKIQDVRQETDVVTCDFCGRIVC